MGSGAKEIAAALTKDSPLQYLGLARNIITSEGVNALTSNLPEKNTNLHMLNIGVGNEIGEAGFLALKQLSCRFDGLRFINIHESDSDVPLSVQCDVMCALAKVCKKNGSIQESPPVPYNQAREDTWNLDFAFDCDPQDCEHHVYYNQPLHRCLYEGHPDLECAIGLIEAGCSLNELDMKGDAALHIACRNGHTAIIDKLADKEVDLNATNANGDGGLHVAMEMACTDVLDLARMEVLTTLLSKGADVNLQNRVGCCLLHLACEKANEEVVKKILEHGKSQGKFVNLDLLTAEGETPLTIALEKHPERTEIMALLLEHGASPIQSWLRPSLPSDSFCKQLRCTGRELNVPQWEKVSTAQFGLRFPPFVLTWAMRSRKVMESPPLGMLRTEIHHIDCSAQEVELMCQWFA